MIATSRQPRHHPAARPGRWSTSPEVFLRFVVACVAARRNQATASASSRHDGQRRPPPEDELRVRIASHGEGSDVYEGAALRLAQVRRHHPLGNGAVREHGSARGGHQLTRQTRRRRGCTEPAGFDIILRDAFARGVKLPKGELRIRIAGFGAVAQVGKCLVLTGPEPGPVDQAFEAECVCPTGAGCRSFGVLCCSSTTTYRYFWTAPRSAVAPAE